MMETTVMNRIPLTSNVFEIALDSKTHDLPDSSYSMRSITSLPPSDNAKSQANSSKLQDVKADPSRNAVGRTNNNGACIAMKRTSVFPQPKLTKKMMLSKSQMSTSTTSATPRQQKLQQEQQPRTPNESRQPANYRTYQRQQTDGKHVSKNIQQRHTIDVLQQQHPQQQRQPSVIQLTTTKKQQQLQKLREQRQSEIRKQLQFEQDSLQKHQNEGQQHGMSCTEIASRTTPISALKVIHQKRKSGLPMPKVSPRPGLLTPSSRTTNNKPTQTTPDVSVALTKVTISSTFVKENESKELRHRLECHRDRIILQKAAQNAVEEQPEDDQGEKNNEEQQQGPRFKSALISPSSGKYAVTEMNSIRNLRERRDVKLKNLQTSMALAKAQNNNVNSNDNADTQCVTVPLGDRNGIENTINNSNHHINTLVSTLTILKQQNLAKAANLVQRLEQRAFDDQR